MEEVTAATSRANHLELQLADSELRYRRLFETAQDGILILDADTGEILDVNPFLLDLLDYPFESMIGLRLWEIGQFQDIAANEAAFEKLQRNEYIRYENLPLETKSGRKIQVEFVSNVYLVGSDKVIQCNIRDISARVKAQELAREYVATLELASQSHATALAMLSHELRTPLTAISYAADVLELGHDVQDVIQKAPPSPGIDRPALALIRRNVQSLVRLINGLLDLTHLAKGTLELKVEKVDAHEVIRFALANLASQQKVAGVKVELHLGAQRTGVQADPGKLEQVISNLIGNALKFTPRGGGVTIATRNEASDQLIIEVSDTGMGIAPEAMARIFSPFQQADRSIHPRFGGLGLGLSIARTLTEAQGGTLEAASAGLNRGAKFTARFTAHDAHPQAAAEG
ncbi:MAG: PAS domain-containing sensor histidine kinase [Verrucomicrobiota bacterium]